MRPGDKILNYSVTRRLKAGGMGIVFEGEQTWGSRRKVAIKQLLENLRDDDTIRRRFIREAEILEMLDYPRIVKILGFDTDQDAFVMEFIEGKTLSDVLREDANTFRQPAVLIPFFTGLLDAFAYAHDVVLTINGQLEQGIVHRDIKPSNIIVQPDGSPKILDFGISRVSSFQSTLTDPKLQMGSIPYMSPEQISTPTDVDWRSDIYSLGVTLWEMLTGRSPYPRVTTHEVVVKVQQQICFDPLPSLIQSMADKRDEEGPFLRRIDQIIAKATAKDRAYRYQHCNEMKLALQHAVDSRESEPADEDKPAPHDTAEDGFTQIRQPAVPLSAPVPEPISPPHSQPPEDRVALPAVEPELASRKTGSSWVLYSAVVVGISLGGFVWWQRSKNPDTPTVVAVQPADSSASTAGQPIVTATDSSYRVGMNYYTSKNYVQALKWFRASAEQGNADGQKYLGNMYSYGQGTERDYAAAMKWFRASADQGNAESCANLGVFYEQGLGVAVNYAEALKWYRRAASQKDPLAQYYVGTMYETGKGTSQSPALAVKWYQQAARQDEPNAQQALRRLQQTW